MYVKLHWDASKDADGDTYSSEALDSFARAIGLHVYMRGGYDLEELFGTVAEGTRDGQVVSLRIEVATYNAKAVNTRNYMYRRGLNRVLPAFVGKDMEIHKSEKGSRVHFSSVQPVAWSLDLAVRR